MIAHIEGILESKSPNQIIIDVNGVGYFLNISLNTFEHQQHQELSYLEFL